MNIENIREKLYYSFFNGSFFHVRNQQNLNSFKKVKGGKFAIDSFFLMSFFTRFKVLQKYRNFLIFEKLKI